jgi:hypothetical protein
MWEGISPPKENFVKKKAKGDQDKNPPRFFENYPKYSLRLEVPWRTLIIGI